MLRQANQVKLFLGLLAITGVTVLAPNASADTVRSTTSTLDRANIRLESVKPVQDQSIGGIERITPKDGKNAWNAVCNGTCGKKPDEIGGQVINPADNIPIDRVQQPIR